MNPDTFQLLEFPDCNAVKNGKLTYIADDTAIVLYSTRQRFSIKNKAETTPWCYHWINYETNQYAIGDDFSNLNWQKQLAGLVITDCVKYDRDSVMFAITHCGMTDKVPFLSYMRHNVHFFNRYVISEIIYKKKRFFDMHSGDDLKSN